MRCSILIRLALAAVIVVTMTLCKQPDKKDEARWHPSWMDDPPKFSTNLDLAPMKPPEAGTLELRWKFGDTQFGYDMKNRVQVKVSEGGRGALDNETNGEVDFNPQQADKAYLTMTSRLGSGLGNPYTRVYTIDAQGRIEEPDPRSQSLIDLIFPLYPEPVVPGQKYTSNHVIPDQDGTAETRGTTTLGIVGFSSVSGHNCAIVAMEHEAHIWSEVDGRMTDTGSVSNLEFIGYFDVEGGMYVAVAIREHSLTKAGPGERTTDRQATYMLRGL